MKNYSILFCCLCFIFTFVNVFAQQRDQLLKNPGFESWTDGVADYWKPTTTASNTSISQSTDAHGGNYAALVAGASSNKRLGSEEITLAAGSYTFSFYAKAATEGVNCKVRPGYVPVDSDNKVGTYVYTTETDPVLSLTEWSSVSYSFDLAESTKVNLVIMNPKNGGDILVDDASLICTAGGEQGGEQGGEETPDVDLSGVISVAEAQAAEVGSVVKVYGTVSALTTRSAVIGDETGYIYYYNTNIGSTLAIGDEVVMEGAVSAYGGFTQFTNTATITKVAEGQTVTYPEAVVLDGHDADVWFNNPKIEFVSVTGTLNISGNYYNLNIEGSETAVCSIIYPIDGVKNNLTNGETVTVRGFAMYTSSNKYINIVATEAYTESIVDDTFEFCYKDGTIIPNGSTIDLVVSDPEMITESFGRIESEIYVKNTRDAREIATLSLNVTNIDEGSGLSVTFGSTCYFYDSPGISITNGVILEDNSINNLWACWNASTDDWETFQPGSCSVIMTIQHGSSPAIDCSTITVNFSYRKKLPEEESAITTQTASLPYNNTFETTTEKNQTAIYDANKDGRTFLFEDGALCYKYSSTKNADDYAVFPGLPLTAGTTYIISIDAWRKSSTCMERFEVVVGIEAKESQLTQVLIPSTNPETSVTNYSAEFVPKTSGIYYFAFHAISDKNMYNLYADNFSVSARPTRMFVDDGVNYVRETAALYDTVTYVRNFPSYDWEAMYLPFSMSFEDWKNDFEIARVNALHQYDDNGDGIIDRSVLEAIKIKEGSTKPNFPYLIRAKVPGNKNIDAYNALLYESVVNVVDCSTLSTKFNFVGTYKNGLCSALSTNPVCYAMEGGRLKKLTQSSFIPSCRWFVEVENKTADSPNYAPRISIIIEDEEQTAIEEIADTEATNHFAYSIDGKMINSNELGRGIRIQRGNKVIMK